jgi:hypothetical protein
VQFLAAAAPGWLRGGDLHRSTVGRPAFLSNP